LVFSGIEAEIFPALVAADIVRAVPVALSGEDFADFAVVDTLDYVLIRCGAATLVARYNAHALFLGFLGKFHHFARLSDIDARGFFEECVLARRHDLRKVRRTKHGRSRLDNQVYILLEELFAAVPTRESLNLRGVEDFVRLRLVFFVAEFLDFLLRIGELVGKQVRHCYDFNGVQKRREAHSGTADGGYSGAIR